MSTAIDDGGVDRLIVAPALGDDAGPLGAVAVGLGALGDATSRQPMGELMTESSGEHPSVGARRTRSGRRSSPRVGRSRSPSSSASPSTAPRLLHRAGGGRAGRRGGAFLTSPEVGPLFGAVLARYLDAPGTSSGAPPRSPSSTPAPVPARSPGRSSPPGRRAWPRSATSPSSCRQRSGRCTRPASSRGPTCRTGRSTASSSPTSCSTTCRSACACSTERGGRRSSSPPTERSAKCCRRRSTQFPPSCRRPRRTARGRRCTSAAVDWVADARSRLRRGRLLAFDYARPTTASLAGRPWREWLRTYRDHGRGDHYLAGPGGQDITAELALDQFPAPDAVATQAQFLQRWGIDELVDEGTGVGGQRGRARPARPGDAQPRLSRRRRLLDPAGLGAFLTLEWSQSEVTRGTVGGDERRATGRCVAVTLATAISVAAVAHRPAIRGSAPAPTTTTGPRRGRRRPCRRRPRAAVVAATC